VVAIRETSASEAFFKVINVDGRLVIIGFSETSAGVRLLRFGVNNTAWRESTAGGDVGSGRLEDIFHFATSLCSGWRRVRLSRWDIEDVQLSSGGLLHNVLLCGIMGDMVAIDDVVIPISASELEGMSTLESECAFPRARLGFRVLGLRKRKLCFIAIP
jgi:hypothetical protein